MISIFLRFLLAYIIYKGWNALFTVTLPIYPNKYKKIIILDACGGSGKRILAKAIADKYGYNYVSLTECKKDKETAEAIQTKLAGLPEMYVLEGTYVDSTCPEQSHMLDALINDADLVLWLNAPKYITLYRKIIGYLKGTESIMEMYCKLRKFFDTHDSNIDMLESLIIRMRRSDNVVDRFKFIQISWPLMSIV